MYEITNFSADIQVAPRLPIAPEVFRESILAVQEELAKFPQVELNITHHFAPGAYGRECFLAAGTMAIGKLHRHTHLNVISKGRIYVATEFGTELLEAPATFVSQAGTKRAVYALEDTIWTTIHVTDETDLEKVEAEVICPDYETFEREQRLLK
jgi:hypothetical protein